VSNIERRFLAILHGDVAGYTELEAGEEATMEMLAACRDLIGASVVASHGRLVDFHGDEFLAEFGSAEHGLQCAVEIQRSIHARNATIAPERRMNFRLGLHVGDVFIEADRISGDSVNIAARLQRLSQPGGICLSHQVLALVTAQMKVEIQDLGEYMLIHRIPNPIHAFSVPATSLMDDPSLLYPSNGSARRRIGGDQGIPTMAVLPFVLSPELEEDPGPGPANDPARGREKERQEALVDGMTADIIMGLSCDKRFSLVAHNSVMPFKGQNPEIKEVGRVLGVRYVVKGRVLKFGTQLRVTTVLIEVETQRELWGARIVREVTDILEVFDQVVEAVVTALSAHLRLAEGERYRRKPPEQLDAWALTARASSYAMNQMTLDDAIQLARRALQIDPEYGHAHAVLGYLIALKYPLGLSDRQADTEASLAATEKALRLDPRDPYSLTTHAVALQYAGRPSESMEYLHRSLRLNPSDVLTHCYYGRGLMFTGKPELALAHFERFNRLNLNASGELIAGMYHSIALVFLQRWKEAEETAHRALAASGRRNPWTWVMLMIALGGQGRHDEATAVLPELWHIAPHFDRKFVEDFLDACQEHKALLPPTFAVLRSVWPPELTRESRGAEPRRQL
jgi:TolB-like protein/class 3 adenylate cyclase